MCNLFILKRKYDLPVSRPCNTRSQPDNVLTPSSLEIHIRVMGTVLTCQQSKSYTLLSSIPSYLICWVLLERKKKSLPTGWQPPDGSLVEAILFMVCKLLSLLGYIWRGFLRIKRLLQETCEEVFQTFFWQCHGKISNLMLKWNHLALEEFYTYSKVQIICCFSK